MSNKGSQRLREARLREGWTQEELGRRSGLSQRVISAMEGGYRTGRFSSWHAVAKALNVSVAWLTETDAAPGAADCGRETVLADDDAPPGLRDLAADEAMCESLRITPEEWRALRSLEAPGLLSREAYVSVLFAMRSGLG